VIGLIVGAAFATALAIESDRLLAQEFPVRIVDPFAFVIAALVLRQE
jgi:putative Ca2+/H+ antiporter (TMEM165/GDT1 family)